jgi:hypothetical protein
MKYGPKNVHKNKVISKRSYLYLRTLSDGDIQQHGLFRNTPECDAPFRVQALQDPQSCSGTVTFPIFRKKLL